MLSWDDRPLTLHQRLTLVDTSLCFLLFTPLQVLFWHGTWDLLDPIFNHAYPSVPALFLLVVSVGIQVAAALFQDRLLPLMTQFLDEEYLPFGKRAYNYVLATTSVCHARCVWELYEAGLGNGAVVALRATLTVIVIMCSLRCVRTLINSPLSLDLDVQHADYTWTTIFRTQAEETKEYTADVLATVGVVFSLGHLYFAGSWHVLAGLSPSRPLLAIVVFFVIGYTCCLDLLLASHKAQQFSNHLKEVSFIARLIFEDIFLLVSSISSTIVWYALWLFFDFMSETFPIYQHQRDVTAIYSHILGYVMLCMCYCSESLVQRDCEIDVELPQGSGVAFATDYFRDFFSEELKDVEDSVDNNETPVAKVDETKNVDTPITNGRIKTSAQGQSNNLTRLKCPSKNDISQLDKSTPEKTIFSIDKYENNNIEIESR